MGFINSCGKVGAVVATGAVYALYYYDPNWLIGVFAANSLLITVASWMWKRETTDIVLRDVREEEQEIVKEETS